MKIYLQLGLILLAFCVVATALLAYVNTLTSPQIQKIKTLEAEATRRELIPDSDFEEVNGEITYYIAKDNKTGEVKGYVFTAQKNGYNGTVKTMAALNKDFQIIAIKVIEQTETPGLGTNSTQPKFTDQFKGKTSEQLIVDKDGGVPPNCIKAITGATITTRAVTNSLKVSIETLKKQVLARTALTEKTQAEEEVNK
ncbi:MAG TPA: RnfABCDGE type electron transport complex subunit G [Candidatus Cloacimonas sp.]|jgi:electron transport complex protein RnfG|nr:RnfABCDGE type electron transport complex subunit G [Candidatus Cloacimonas sp.]HPS60630.1 RnfABCDGE type electron transport complex subunit G [Candidatus Cloacimonas sp.]